MKRNPIMEEARKLIDKDKYPMEYLMDLMEHDPWYIKLTRWFRVQLWIIRCLLFNNKFMRKVKKYPSEFWAIILLSIVIWIFIFCCCLYYDNGILLSIVISTLLTLLANMFSFASVTTM